MLGGGGWTALCPRILQYLQYCGLPKNTGAPCNTVIGKNTGAPCNTWVGKNTGAPCNTVVGKNSGEVESLVVLRGRQSLCQG